MSTAIKTGHSLGGLASTLALIVIATATIGALTEAHLWRNSALGVLHVAFSAILRMRNCHG